MRTVAEFLTRTPLWVYAIFCYLIWQGAQGLRTRTTPLWRLLIMPTVFVAMGASRLLQVSGAGAAAYPAWAVAAVIFAGVALATTPRVLTVDRSKGTLTLPGSVWPLIRNGLVFALQYAVAASAAMQVGGPEIAMIGHAVSGATAGYFIGRATTLIRRYRNDSQTAAEPAG